MNPFPNQSEVLVSVLSKSEVENRLDKVTHDTNFLDHEDRNKKGFKFNGQVSEGVFSLSLVIDRADSFLPLILGKIETAPHGCIIFLEYRLFPSSAFFLGFWTIVTLVLAVLFWFITYEPWYSVFCLLACIGNYWFAWNYFKKKIKVSKEIFYQILNLQ